MPYTEAHHKITVWGDSYAGSEQWSFGFRMQSVDPVGTAQSRAASLGPIVSAFWSNTTTPAFLSSHRLQGVKVAAIGTDGKYPDGHVPGEVWFANVPGPKSQATNSYVIPQSSIAVTMTTAAARGLASMGRFFLPPTDVYIEASGLLPTTLRDALVTKVKDFLNSVNAMEAGNSNVAIFSRGKGVKSYNATTKKIEWDYPNPGVTNPVTGVEIGRVVDTQRRRRRSLVESRAGAALS
jgi:hypothetical protein